MPSTGIPGLLGIKIVGNSPVAKSIHIGLLMDTSGSMEGGRIDSVKRTMTVLLDHLVVGDKITLVGFSDKASTVFKELTIIDDPLQKPTLLGEISAMVADGGTNLECGISMMGQILTGGTPLNAIALLTDGEINDGISTTAGLYSMIKSYFNTVPVYTLGYGTSHNADLLKALALRSHANYTFIQDEIVLPISMGDMLGAIKTEVATDLSLGYDSRWYCAEPMADPGASNYDIGSLTADKPMWVLFKVPFGLQGSALTIKYKENGVDSNLSFQPTDGECDSLDIIEQAMRCETGIALNKVAEAMKRHKLTEAKDLLTSVLSVINSSQAVSRPLVIVMKAQIEETLEEVNKAISGHHVGFTPADLLYRTTSLGGNYSAQRGVTQMADAQTPNLFSSPAQIVASQAMSAGYSQSVHDPQPMD